MTIHGHTRVDNYYWLNQRENPEVLDYLKAENAYQEQFGDDHLLDILRHTDFENARQVVEGLKAEVERHRNGAEANDDLTIMCIRAS